MTKRIIDCTVEELVNSITTDVLTKVREEKSQQISKKELPLRMNPVDAADFISKSVHTLRGYVRDSKIKSHLIGHNRWFFTADLKEWVENGGRHPNS